MSPLVGVPIAPVCVSRRVQLYKGADVQFTIETRDLSNPRSDRTTIEAANADDAITQFVRSNASELMSLTKPCDGRESIGTIRKNDSVLLVRVYSA